MEKKHPKLSKEIKDKMAAILATAESGPMEGAKDVPINPGGPIPPGKLIASVFKYAYEGSVYVPTRKYYVDPSVFDDLPAFLQKNEFPDGRYIFAAWWRDGREKVYGPVEFKFSKRCRSGNVRLRIYKKEEDSNSAPLLCEIDTMVAEVKERGLGRFCEDAGGSGMYHVHVTNSDGETSEVDLVVDPPLVPIKDPPVPVAPAAWIGISEVDALRAGNDNLRSRIYTLQQHLDIMTLRCDTAEDRFKGFIADVRKVTGAESRNGSTLNNALPSGVWADLVIKEVRDLCYELRGKALAWESSTEAVEKLHHMHLDEDCSGSVVQQAVSTIDRLRADVEALRGDLVFHDDALSEDEIEIAKLVLSRLKAGRKNYGPWKVDDGRDYPLEMLSELLDGMMYDAAEIVRLRRLKEKVRS